MHVGGATHTDVERFTCVSRGLRACSGVNVRAHSSLLVREYPDVRADVYASSQHPPGLAKTQTTSPQTALFRHYLARWSAFWLPRPSECLRGGGNCTTRGCNTPATRRQRASCSAKPPHRPRHRAARLSTVRLRHQRTVTSHGPALRQTIMLELQVHRHEKPPVSWRNPRNGRLSMKVEAEA